MNKVICDVCGTDYPETAAQCPICGCATAGGQTSAGNAALGDEENAGYTYVKGGRFSKSNVRKRLKANQVQESRFVEPEPEDIDDEDDEDDEELEQEEGSSNRGLVIVVVLLLLAIIAVSIYIAVSIFGVGSGDEENSNKNPVSYSTSPTMSSVAPTSSEEEQVDRIACTGLRLSHTDITLQSINGAWDLKAVAEPANTTDKIVYASSDESVVIVDSTTGRVTAVGNGEAEIIVTCGDQSVKCPVSCVLSDEPTVSTDETTDPSDATATTDETDTTEATEPEDTTDATATEDTTAATEPSDGFTLKLKSSDFTLFAAGDTYALYNGDVASSQITWTSADESVATIANGIVTAVGPGRTRLTAEYNGQKVVCMVSCRFEVEDSTEPTESTENTDPTTSTDSTEATEPTEELAQGYALRVNGEKCIYGDDYKAEATIAVGESFKLSIVDGNNVAQDVTWSLSKDGVCTIDGTKVTGSAKGKVILTVTYEGKTYTCTLIVR